jgi:hypothetical protein
MEGDGLLPLIAWPVQRIRKSRLHSTFVVVDEEREDDG